MAKFKSLNIGDTVRVVSLADTGARCGDPLCLNQYIGGTFEVTGLDRQPGSGLGRAQLSNGWWFSPKGLEVLTPTEPTVAAAPTGDEHGEFVTPETPVGTRVLYVGDNATLAEVGAEFILRRHDSDEYPRVDYTYKDDYEYIHYSNLRVAATQLGAEHGGCTACTEPTPDPVVHTNEDFKYTRVRVKDTGAEGVVVGRSQYANAVAVLHDEVSVYYHDGNTHEVDFVGVPKRIRYYPASDLEIIGGVQ